MYPFSLSYWVNLPSSLDFVNLFALVYSTKLRAFVLSTVNYNLKKLIFLNIL